MEFLGFTIDIATLTDNAIDLGLKVILALLIYFIGRWIAEKASNIAKHIMQRSKLDAIVSDFLSRLLYGVLLVIVILAALNQVGVQTNSVVAILGGAAVAIGLALSNQLSNFAAGIMIIVFRPFVKGDTVKISDYTGAVVQITLINTHITTLNNHDVIIPNSDISTSAIINYSSLPNRRVDVTVGIGYTANIKNAKNIMLNIAREHPLSHADPEPFVYVTNLGDSAVDLTLHVWTSNSDWIALEFELLEAFKLAFDDNDIEIPFPQRSVHVEGLDKLISNIDTPSNSLSK